MKRLHAYITSLFLLCFSVLALAAEDTPGSAETAFQTAMNAAVKASQSGHVTLSDQGSIDLGNDFRFIPAAESKSVLEAMGNQVGDNHLGMILSPKDGLNWFMVVSYHPAGFIKDDDARDWNADDLLASVKEGTESANEMRRQQGFPEMEIVGWVQKPLYFSDKKQLVWSIQSHDKGQSADEENGINYNTLALGREGYISMNLVTGMSQVEELKPVANDLLSHLNFNEGKRYADFDASTDHVAEYGLAALVAGVAAKKLGMFALAAAFFAKFAKVIAVAAIGLVAGVRKFFGRGK